MSVAINNPITRAAVKAIVTYAYVRLALDSVGIMVKISDRVKTRFAR